MRVLFLCCTVESVRFSVFNYACPVWCLQYDCAVPHDDVGPRGDALRGGNRTALLPFSLQVSRALGTACKIIALSGHLNVIWSALETRRPNVGLFWSLTSVSHWVSEYSRNICLGFRGTWRNMPDNTVTWACCSTDPPSAVSHCSPTPDFSFVFVPLNLRKMHRQRMLIINFGSHVNWWWRCVN